MAAIARAQILEKFRAMVARGQPIVGGGRESMLGRVAVVDGHDDGAGLHAQIPTERIVGIVAAEHPTTTVEVDGDRVRPVGRRPVQAVLERRAVGADWRGRGQERRPGNRPADIFKHTAGQSEPRQRALQPGGPLPEDRREGERPRHGE